MSGIAGIIHFDGKPVEPGQIEKMTAAMAHRGPDGTHHWVRGSVALGQCMLRTTPESLEEQQPLGNEDESLVLVMDGRVDNFEELGKELTRKGSALRNRSDAELVLRAYEAWGAECPSRIIGEFVFFIWDSRARRLFGARDPAGTRQFYYFGDEKWFSFSSEIKGLLQNHNVKPKLNESRLLDYLVRDFDRDDVVGTFYERINRLPAGHAISVSSDKINIWRYWDPSDLPPLQFSSLMECQEAFLEQLLAVVKCRLRSISPVGAMLSGGIDSSSIVGLISGKLRSELGSSLHTFSLIRNDRENCPDWRSISEILAKDDWLKSTLIESSVVDDKWRDTIKKISDSDEPFAFSHGLPYSYLFDVTRENGCKVLLDGIAGDLLFYGPYRSMDSAIDQKSYNLIPGIIRAFCKNKMYYQWIFSIFIKAGVRVSPDALKAIARKARDVRALKTGDLGFLRPEISHRYLAKKRASGLSKSGSYPSNDRARHATYFTSGLLSFAHEVYGQEASLRGVELRSPYADRRMIEFAIRMPLEAKLSINWYKYLFRGAMEGVLSDGVRWRRDMGGHPGWRFYDRLMTVTRASAPEFWDEVRIEGELGRWLEGSSLRREFRELSESTGFIRRYRLFGFAILARWLQSRPNKAGFLD